MARTAAFAAKSRNASPAVSAGLRMVAMRVAGALALTALAAGLYLYHGRPVARIVEAPRPAVVVAAPPPAAVAPPVAPVAAVAPPPAPPRREASLDAVKPMPASLRTAFDAWLMGAYAKCWKAPKSLPDGDPYLAKVRVALREDGGLAAAPRLVNPPADPAWKAHAEAALKAVKGCDPLHVPDKYAEYYPSWKSKTVYFDPTRN